MKPEERSYLQEIVWGGKSQKADVRAGGYFFIVAEVAET